MAEIRNLTRNGETFYPLTHEKAVIGMEDFKETITEQIDNYRPIEITGDVTNAPDEEDITSDSNNLLKFKNRNNLYGLGKVILRRGSSFASQVTQANTIYVIQYNFDLGSARINIPNGSILLFEGGTLSNGTLVCADLYDVRLVYYQDQSEILSSVTLEGNFIHKACDKDTIRQILVDNSSITKDVNDVLSVKANGIQNSHLNSNTVDNSGIALDTNNKISIKDGGVTGAKLNSGVVNTDDLSIVSNKIQLADRGTTNGMGMIILRKDLSFASQLTQTNTIYVIRYDYTLINNVTVPVGSILKFEGGSLNGEVTITGQETSIQSGPIKIFSTNLTFAGTWYVPFIYPELFGAKGDGATDDADSIQAAELFAHCVIEKRIPINSIKQYYSTLSFLCKVYKVSKTIYVGSNINVEGNGCVIRAINGSTYEDNYILKHKEITTTGDHTKIMWDYIHIQRGDYVGTLNGIYWASQGYIKRIGTLGIDCVLNITQTYKDFVEVDGFTMLDGDPDTYKIVSGYLGDGRVFKNIWASGKALDIKNAHFTVSIDHVITGAVRIDTSDVNMSNCMFNSSLESEVIINGGASVVMTNCYFGVTGKPKISLADGMYYHRHCNLTLINCKFNYEPRYFDVQNFVDTPIVIPDLTYKPNIRFIDTYFCDSSTITQNDTYSYSPHIDGYDGFNLFSGYQHSLETMPFLKLNGNSNISGVETAATGHTLNLLGTTETWSYAIYVVYDVKRQLIGTSLNRTVDVTPSAGAKLSFYLNTEKPLCLVINKTRGNINEYVIIPMGDVDDWCLDNGLTIAGRKWQNGICDVSSYASTISGITYKSVNPKSDFYNVEVVTSLTEVQFQNRIVNHNSSSWENGDIIVMGDNTRRIKHSDGNWYTINETLVS